MDIFLQARPLDRPARPPLRTFQEKAHPSPVNVLHTVRFCVSPGMHQQCCNSRSCSTHCMQIRMTQAGGVEGVHLKSGRGIVTSSAGLLLTANQQHIILDSNTDILTSQPCGICFWRQWSPTSTWTSSQAILRWPLPEGLTQGEEYMHCPIFTQ